MSTVVIVYDRGIRNPFYHWKVKYQNSGVILRAGLVVYDQPLSVDLPAKSVV